MRLLLAPLPFLLLALGACTQGAADSTLAVPTSVTSTTQDTAGPETTTSTMAPLFQVSLDQVLGGSVASDGDPPPEVADLPLAHSSMRAITVAGSTLIAGGSASPAGSSTDDAAVWTSADGVRWAPIADDAGAFGDAMAATDEPGHQFINDIAAGPLGVLAVGADGSGLEHTAAIWRSSDGAVWQRIPHDEEVFGGDGAQVMNSVVQMSGLAVVVGESNWRATVWVSTDGSQWARADVNDESITRGERSSMKDVVVTGSGLVAVGRGGEEPRPAAWLSSDGLTWDRLVDSMAGAHSGFSAAEPVRSAMIAVAVGEEGLVATGVKLLRDEDPSTANQSTAGALVWTSIDGYDWTLVEPNFLELSGERESSRYAYMKRGAPVLLEDILSEGDRLLAIGGYELALSANVLPSFITLWVSIDGGATWQIADEMTLEPTDQSRGAWAFSRFGDSLVIVGNDDTPAGKHPDYGWMTYVQTPAVWIAGIPEG